MSDITFEAVVELEARVAQTKMYEQYLEKIIELLDIQCRLYLSAVEAEAPFCRDMPWEIFRLCTAPLAIRHEAAMFVLAHPELPRYSLS